MVFQNRSDAGRQLAAELAPYRRENCIVLALPRGGVPVGFEVAKLLEKPLDILVVRKIGAPGQEELALGAVGPGDVVVWNRDLLHYFNLTPAALQDDLAQAQAQLSRRLFAFRGERPYPSLLDKTVILVDDGLATGASARAALLAVRALNPAKVVLAVPVGAQSTVSELRKAVDELICLLQPESLRAVGAWYVHFDQTSDQEVIDLLHRAWQEERARDQVL